MQRLVTDRLLAGKAGVRMLVAVLQEQTPLGPTDADLVEVALRDLAPPADWPYWLLVLEAAQNRAVGAVEAWLDSGELEEDPTDYLLELLEQVLERGAGSLLTMERFEALAVDAFGRVVDIDELVGPACYLVNIVLASPDALNTVLGEPDDECPNLR
jgi:hypothetical protein